MLEFQGVCDFDRSQNGLVPVRVDDWEQFVFATLDENAPPLGLFLGQLRVGRAAPTDKSCLFTAESYTLNCNWKVFVDNYLDGGYHVPHPHKGLNSVLDYTQYTIENEHAVCSRARCPRVPGPTAESPRRAGAAPIISGSIRIS